MSQDHRKLEVSGISDDLMLDVYRRTRGFPALARYSELVRALEALVQSLKTRC
jgi:hypothetical protein